MGSMIGAVCTPSRTMMLTGRSWQRIPGAPAAAANADDPATFLPRVLAAAFAEEVRRLERAGGDLQPGMFVPVEIVERRDYDLIGVALDDDDSAE